MQRRFSQANSQGSQSSPDSDGLRAVVQQLCSQLSKGKAKKGQVKTPDAVKTIRDILNSYRARSQKVNDDVLIDIEEAMEKGGGKDFCSQMEPAVFCVILETILQAEAWMQAQRVIHFLAASLHQDTVDVEMEETIKGRKEHIARVCLDRLFMYFADKDQLDAICMRRWVGILCIELIRASEGSIYIADRCADSTRRAIGRMVLHDTDDILRFVAGELVKTLIEGGMSPENLWPNDENVSYQAFPLTTSSRAGWVKTFDQWIESVYASKPELAPPQVGEVFLVYKIEINPNIGFGAPDYMAVLSILDDFMSILAPTNDGNMDQILDVKLSCLKSIHTIPDESSQAQEMHITLELNPDNSMENFLDAGCIQFDSITLIMDIDSGVEMAKVINAKVPEIEFNCTENDDELSLLDADAQMSTQTVFSEILRREASADLYPSDGLSKRVHEDENEKSHSSQEYSSSPDIVQGPPDGDDQEVMGEVDLPRGIKFKVDSAEIICRIEDVDTSPDPQRNDQNHSKQKAKTTTSRITRSTGSLEVVESGTTKQPSMGSANPNRRSISSGATDEKKESRDIDKAEEGIAESKAEKRPKAKVKPIAKQPLAKQARQSKPAAKETKMLSNHMEDVVGPNGVLDIHEDQGHDVSDNLVSEYQDREVNSQKQQHVQIAAISATRKKKYNLHGSRPESSQQLPITDVFDIPDDDGEVAEEKLKKRTPKAKTKSNTKTAAASTGKANKKDIPKPPAKPKAKRKSAPAGLNEPVAPARESQRAAAAKAKKKILNMNANDNESAEKNDSLVQKKSMPKLKSSDDVSEESQTISKKNTVLVVGKVPDIIPKTNIEDKTVKATTRGVAKSDEIMNVKKTTELEEHSSKKAVVREDGLAKINSAESDLDLNQFHRTNGSLFALVTKSSTTYMTDEDFDVGNETEPPVSRPRIDPVAYNAINEVGESSKNILIQKFADKLGNLLGGALDEPPKVTVLTGTTELAIEISREKPLLSNNESFPSTSLVLPSPNLVNQDSTMILPGRETPKIQKEKGPSVEVDKSSVMGDHVIAVEVPTRLDFNHAAAVEVLQAQVVGLKSFQVQQPEISTGEFPETTLPHKFRKPDIPAKSMAQAVGYNEEARDGIPSRDLFTNPKTRETDLENKAIQSSTETTLFGNTKGLVSSDTSQTDDNFERDLPMAEVQKKRKSTIDTSPKFAIKRTRFGKTPMLGPASLGMPAAGFMPHENLKSARRSPNLPRPPTALNSHPTNHSAAEKDPARKPNLITFDKGGARNQGRLSTQKLDEDTESAMAASGDDVERKRKRVNETSIDKMAQTPPRKRQHSSPIQHEEIFAEDIDEDLVNCDHEMEESSSIVMSVKHRSRSTRNSSLVSRVDNNGSPIAASDVDHIGRLKERLAQNQETQPQERIPDQLAESLGNEAETVFAPRAQLGRKKKPHLSILDEEVSSRYIPHEKTALGEYQGLQTREVVAPETDVVDPFLEPAAKPTPFTDRLRQKVSRETETGQKQIQKFLPGQQRRRRPSPLISTRGLKGNHLRNNFSQDRSKLQDHEDLERTPVETNQFEEHQRSPAEMTNGSSLESPTSSHSTRQSEDRPPLSERWNMAIRPHYKNFYQAIHGVADEVIIRLADEEDRMELIVKQYDENGTKVLDKMEQKRASDKSAILHELESKSTDMKTVHTKSRNHIQGELEGLRENSINDFEKEWKKRQDDIQKAISSAIDSLK